MKKKVFSVILALVLVLSSTMLVLADPNQTDDVDVRIDLTLKSQNSDWAKSVTEVNEAKVDFKAVLATEDIKTAIKKWYNEGLKKIDELSDGNEDTRDILIGKLDKRVIDGEFTIKIDYPAFFNVPAGYISDNNDMYGFNEEAKIIFHEVRRAEEKIGERKVLTIIIATNAPGNIENPLLAEELVGEKLEENLSKLEFTVSDVKVSTVGSHEVTASMDGHTVFGLSKDDSIRVNFKGQPEVGANLRVDVNITTDEEEESAYYHSGGGGGGISGTTGGANTGNGENAGGNQTTGGSDNNTYNIGGSNSITLPSDETTGTTGSGDSTTGRTGQQIQEMVEEQVQKDGYTVVVYEDPEKTRPIDPSKTYSGNTFYLDLISDTFNSEDHVAYVIGYPDGNVRPLNNITREEVATILYRLLRDDKRASIISEENNFSDVSADRWSNRSISTMANGAYIYGYEDGTFAPAKNITRAEFATMIVRYAQAVNTAAAGKFSDISGHWAEQYILIAAGEQLISGYEDGTFAPDQYITRAEAMTILNRMLSRKVNAEGLHADVIIWPDNSADAWYYYDVEEATNSHKYTRQSDGLTENWSELIENRDWANL
ncbi:MAG: S-layer homology domain-containing protein [Clostridia bacterium]|nr:S-layer homology domain-containing protein [Clostridia bacterium]